MESPAGCSWHPADPPGRPGIGGCRETFVAWRCVDRCDPAGRFAVRKEPAVFRPSSPLRRNGVAGPLAADYAGETARRPVAGRPFSGGPATGRRASPMSETIWFLKRCPLFERLSPEESRRLEARALARTFAKREIIYFPDDPGQTIL